MRIENRKPIPTETRRAVYARARGCCEECGGDQLPLELHHRWYTKPALYATKDCDQVSVLGIEVPEDLLALCRACHLAKHVDPCTREFYSDPQELENEIAYREHMARDD